MELSSVMLVTPDVLWVRGASLTIRGPMMKPRALPPSRHSQDSPVAMVRWWTGNQRELTTEGRDTTNGPMLPLRIPPCHGMRVSHVTCDSDDTCMRENLEYQPSVRMIKKQPLKASDPRSYQNDNRTDNSPGPADVQS